MNAGSSFPADAESFEAVEPGKGRLDHPAVGPQPGAVPGAAASDGRHDVSGSDLVGVYVVVDMRAIRCPNSDQMNADCTASSRETIRHTHRPDALHPTLTSSLPKNLYGTSCDSSNITTPGANRTPRDTPSYGSLEADRSGTPASVTIISDVFSSALIFPTSSRTNSSSSPLPESILISARPPSSEITKVLGGRVVDAYRGHCTVRGTYGSLVTVGLPD